MDDAWRCVFEMLSTIERIRCERVCRKWRNLLREQWKITTSIDTETACHGVPLHQWSMCIENIIDRCSNRIETFMFGTRANNLKVFPTKVELNENIFEKILMKSPKLRVFQVTNSLVPLISLSMFERMPCSLQVFRLESCVIDVNKPEIVRYSLMQMFERCTSLKEFSITGRGSCYGHLVIDDYLLNEIPASIEKLSISAGDSLKIRDADFVQHLRKLLSFSAQRSFLSTRSLTVIVSACVELIHLDLSFARQIIDFSPIARLTLLKSLVLNGNRDNFIDDHLSQIVAGCRRLEQLSLESCTQLTESGLLNIKECTHMKRLNLLGQCCITDLVIWSIVGGCSQIEELDITYCTRISRAGLCSVLQLPRLKHLQVSGVQEFDTRLAKLLNKVLPQCKLTAENCKYSTEREKGLQRKMKSLLPVETAVTAFFRLDD